jgi:Tol biopolymer transport system component
VVSLVGIALVAGSRTPVPPPFGVARNGFIAYTDSQGQLWRGDLGSLETTKLASTTQNSRPVFSPDGRRLLYLHTTTPGDEVIVARADGSEPRVINPKPIGSVGYLQWSPDSRSVVLSLRGSSTIFRFDADATADPTVVADDPNQDLRDGGDFQSPLEHLFQPPAGAALLTIGRNGDHDTLIVTATNGSGSKVILDDPRYKDILAATWSPDGQRIALDIVRDVEPFPYHTYLINADGTDLHRLIDDVDRHSEANPLWSPDGRSIAVQRWFYLTDGGIEPRPITIVDLENGGKHEIGSNHPNGYTSWAWSPDGTSIVEVPGNLPGETQTANPVIVVNATTGKEKLTGWMASSAVGWQRQANP